MPKRAEELTALKVKAIKAPGLHAMGGVPGLYLQVTEGTGRSWVYRYKLGGDGGTWGLARPMRSAWRMRGSELPKRAGSCSTGSIRSRRARPSETRRRSRAAKAMTFRQCAEAYIAAHQAGWKNPVHAKQWPSTLGTYVYPVFGDLPVHAVDVGLVMKALEPIWTEKPETASRVRGRIECVLDWATARGYRQGENPARWRGHLENLLPKKTKVRRVEHHAALPYAEIGAFMTELRQQEAIAARALEFAILTARAPAR